MNKVRRQVEARRTDTTAVFLLSCGRAERDMARLLRFVRLDDSFDTQVFTFALPESLPCLESVRAPGATPEDFVSRDFNYGHQRWRYVAVKRSSEVLEIFPFAVKTICVTYCASISAQIGLAYANITITCSSVC